MLIGSLLVSVLQTTRAQKTFRDRVVSQSISAPRPEYPLEARARRWTGGGVVVMEVDSTTGKVTTATMVRSTGHKILDDAAVAAFRRWSFKPGTVTRVTTPIRFTLGRSATTEADQVVASLTGGIAIYAPAPQPPREAVTLKPNQGKGIFRLRIARHGNVADVKVLQSTGSEVLDGAAVAALREWYFKIGSTEIDIPIDFKLKRAR